MCQFVIDYDKTTGNFLLDLIAYIVQHILIKISIIRGFERPFMYVFYSEFRTFTVINGSLNYYRQQ